MKGNGIIRLCLYLLIFINGFLLNVVLHEVGHYMAADYYNLEPKIDFDFKSVGNLSFGFKATPIASTSFNEPRTTGELVVVALAGPFFNLILGILFLMIFIFSKKEIIKELMLICFVISIASFVMNILPLDGADGSLVFGS